MIGHWLGFYSAFMVAFSAYWDCLYMKAPPVHCIATHFEYEMEDANKAEDSPWRPLPEWRQPGICPQWMWRSHRNTFTFMLSRDLPRNMRTEYETIDEADLKEDGLGQWLVAGRTSGCEEKEMKLGLKGNGEEPVGGKVKIQKCPVSLSWLLDSSLS